MIDKKLLDILCCPECKVDLVITGDSLFCAEGDHAYKVIEGIPVLLPSEVSWEVNISHEKWHDFYKDFKWEDEKKHYTEANLPYIFKYLEPCGEKDLFLEIGGGPSFLSFSFASKGLDVVSLDFDLEILKIAKKQFDKHGCQGFFVCANINKLPFKEKTFDFSAGLGVIEHAGDVEATLLELKRITKAGGYIFQTVPCFSLLTLVNNALRYGTMTPIRSLNALIALVHIRLLGSSHMKYGYEESYNVSYLKKVLHRIEFKEITINFYDYNQTLFKKYGTLLSGFVRRFIKHRLFWDIIYIKASK